MQQLPMERITADTIFFDNTGATNERGLRLPNIYTNYYQAQLRHILVSNSLRKEALRQWVVVLTFLRVPHLQKALAE
jgi:hypothetical protein